VKGASVFAMENTVKGSYI